MIGLSPIAQRIFAALLAVAVAAPLLHYGRGFEWSFSLILGLGFGVLGFLLVRAIQNLRSWRPRR